MKKLTQLLLFILITLSTFGQSADEQIGECLNNSDFFLLDEKYPQLKDEIQTPLLNTLSESVLAATFNRPKEAIPLIDSLLIKHQGELDLNSITNMVMWQANLLFRKGEYCEVSERVKSFFEQIMPYIDSASVKGIDQTIKYYSAMCGQGKSELVRPAKDCSIPIFIENIELEGFRKGQMLYVPATINGKEERFIFDTGCSGGIHMSEEYAKRYGVKVMLDSLMLRGAHSSNWAKMGILDSLNIGDMTFKNAVVTIAPPNPTVDTIFKIDLVLGSDIMKLAGEIQILPQERKIIFPINKTPLPATGRNMMMTQGDIFLIKSYSEDERLIMILDTGDSSAALDYPYYQKNKDEVEKEGKKGTLSAGGFGGIITSEHYTLPTVPFRIGNKEFMLNDINVGIDPKKQHGRDGSLGMKFITLFDKVVISFDQMFIEVE